MRTIEAINRSRRIALTSDGHTIPVTDWFCGGADCDPEEATAAVAGPDPDGKWHALDLSEYEETETH